MSLDLAQPVPVTFDAKINGAATLQGQGKVVPEPFAADVDIKLADFPLAALQPYVNGTADLTIKRGTVGAAGRFSLAPAGAGRPELAFAGDATLAGFSSIDNALEQDFLNFERVELSKLKFALAPDSMSIDRVRVVQPFARVIISSDAVLNVAAGARSRGHGCCSRRGQGRGRCGGDSATQEDTCRDPRRGTGRKGRGGSAQAGRQCATP